MIPPLVATKAAGPRTQVAALAVVALLLWATLNGYAHGAAPGPQLPQFVAISATIWAVAELLTAFLLLSQFYVAGRIAPAVVAAGYLLSGLLTVPYLVFFPGVFVMATNDHGFVQVSVWLWLAWHLLFPIMVATAHLIDPSLERIEVPRPRIPGMLAMLVAGTTALAGAIFAAIVHARDWLPAIVVAGGHFSPAYRTFAVPPIVILNGIAIAIVAARGRRLTSLQTWLVVALLTMALDGLLNIWSPGRYSLAWYTGKFEALIMATVVLFMLLLEVATAYRRLYEVATIDVLTGLPNRRKFIHAAATTLAKPERIRAGVALLVVDVDHFKLYNDRYGHAGGDEALTAVAAALRTSLLRADDSVARYGGEEFVILLPNMLAGDAEAVAERVRRHVSRLGIGHEASPSGRLTVSIGIGYSSSSFDVSESVLFESADRALYEAKAKGRNCAVLRHVRETTLVAVG